MVDFFSSNPWILWISVALIFLVIEIFILDFSFIILSASSLLGALLSLMGIPTLPLVIIVSILSLLLLIFCRKPLRRLLSSKESASQVSNVDAIIGMSGQTISKIDNDMFTVKLSNGETWTANFFEPQTQYQDKLNIFVEKINGATLSVALDERTSNE